MIYDPFKEEYRDVKDCTDYELENIGHNTYSRLIHERNRGVFFGPSNLEWIDAYEKQLEEIKEELQRRNPCPSIT